MLTRLAAAAAAALLVPTLAACGSSSTPKGTSCSYPSDSASPARAVDPPPDAATQTGNVTATLDTTIGPMTFTLDAATAPCTVSSFVSLAQQGYFDQSPCHRLTTAGIFVLQCGDPTGTGTGGPGYTVPDELSGQETYGPGTLAMANNSAPNTGGSQFFIVHGDSTGALGKLYTVFGHIDAAGLKEVQSTAKEGTDNAFGQGDGHPTVPVTLTKVTIG